MIKFRLVSESLQARAGELTTPHGVVQTPVFMPVGTQATVKALTPEHLRAAGVSMLLCNAYHLSLRPGADLVQKMGGLHKFMGWDGPILTDSGGFQVFSLARLRKVTDDGVLFRSHVDGEEIFLTPELCVEIENQLGADVIMTLDECCPYPSEKPAARAAMERTLAWTARCRDAHRVEAQTLFAIVQGGTYPDLRVECAERLTAMGFDGYAIGGLSVGEGPELMRETLAVTLPKLPPDRPRYLMGVGLPEDLLECVAAGIDMFDCVIPTRSGRNALAFTTHGRVKIRNLKHRESDMPLDADCDCMTCQRFSRAYLRHLFMAGEMLGMTLLSLHNVHFYTRLMRRIRKAILAGPEAFAALRAAGPYALVAAQE